MCLTVVFFSCQMVLGVGIYTLVCWWSGQQARRDQCSGCIVQIKNKLFEQNCIIKNNKDTVRKHWDNFADGKENQEIFCFIFLDYYKFKIFLNLIPSMADFSLTTFASKGKLPQIQNALAAVAKGQTSLGIKAKNGVVIATEKKLASTLMDETSYYKTQIFCDHIGGVYAGLGPDFRVLSQKTRKLVQDYFVKYFEPIGVQALCRKTSEEIQEKTQSGGYRPFGISVLVGGYDDEGPHLTQIDPSGAFYNWKATAVGKGAKNAKTFLQKRFKPEMQIQDAIHTALLTLKQGFEGVMDNTNIEVAVVREDRKFHILSSKQIKQYLDQLQ